MAPILLKVKGNLQSLPFGNLDSSDDLSKTWRVCTKVKDSLENGSRLENLSWRLWFAHNVNRPTNTNITTNFKVPDNFDFKAQDMNKIKKLKIESMEVEYKRKLSLQQKKQAEVLFNQSYLNRQREEFTLQQFTSDQAGDQVIELDDMFKSFGADIQAYLDPTEEQQLDNLINESWPISSSNSSYNELINSNATSPIAMTFGTMATQQSQPQQSQSQSQSQQSQQPPPPNYNQQYNPSNHNNHINHINQSVNSTQNGHTTYNNQALYVSSEAMPPIPIGTLHNKLLATLPKETLESAGRLLSTTPEEPPVDSSYRFFMPPQPVNHNNHHPSSNASFNFSHHHLPQHSKSLPPSRAASPPPPSDIPPQRRATAPINSSPSEGKAPICSNCSTASTPLWRRSANDELLCNACGLYLKLHNAPRPKYLKPQSSRKDLKGEDENIIQPLCSNCGTSTTPLWRRDLEGAPLCNACGLYLKLHHEKRPLSMKTDNIKKRQRCDNNAAKSSVPQPSTTVTKKKNRMVEEPLTTTFESSTYQYMQDVVPTSTNTEYSPFGAFGLTLTNQPI